MATSLDKDLIRESTVKSEDREIVVTLSANQEIKLKLKGMKSGEVKISILDLYNQLTGKASEEVFIKEEKPKKGMNVITRKEDNNEHEDVMINLQDLRSLNVITGFDIPMMAKFDGLISDLINTEKEKRSKLKKK